MADDYKPPSVAEQMEQTTKAVCASILGWTGPLGLRSIYDAQRLLNEALSADPEAIQKLVGLRAPCNDFLGDHPTITTWGEDDGTQSIGLLGILNGLFAGRVRLCATYNSPKDGKLLRFDVVFPPDQQRVEWPRSEDGNGEG